MITRQLAHATLHDPPHALVSVLPMASPGANTRSCPLVRLLVVHVDLAEPASMFHAADDVSCGETGAGSRLQRGRQQGQSRDPAAKLPTSSCTRR